MGCWGHERRSVLVREQKTLPPPPHCPPSPAFARMQARAAKGPACARNKSMALGCGHQKRAAWACDARERAGNLTHVERASTSPPTTPRLAQLEALASPRASHHATAIDSVSGERGIKSFRLQFGVAAVRGFGGSEAKHKQGPRTWNATSVKSSGER